MFPRKRNGRLEKGMRDIGVGVSEGLHYGVGCRGEMWSEGGPLYMLDWHESYFGLTALFCFR